MGAQTKKALACGRLAHNTNTKHNAQINTKHERHDPGGLPNIIQWKLNSHYLYKAKGRLKNNKIQRGNNKAILIVKQITFQITLKII